MSDDTSLDSPLFCPQSCRELTVGPVTTPPPRTRLTFHRHPRRHLHLRRRPHVVPHVHVGTPPWEAVDVPLCMLCLLCTGVCHDCVLMPLRSGRYDQCQLQYGVLITVADTYIDCADDVIFIASAIIIAIVVVVVILNGDAICTFQDMHSSPCFHGNSSMFHCVCCTCCISLVSIDIITQLR